MLLPVPTEQEIQGFIELYRTKYGTDLDPGDAGRMLGGLMRFLYLTRTDAPLKSEENEAASFDGRCRSRQESSRL